MFYNLKNKLGRAWFDHRARGVLRSLPVTLVKDANAPAVLSQVQHKDVLMYLGAVQSFACRLALAEVHVVSDGSLTEADRALLARQIPGIQFHELADCREPGLPQGACWERLTAIARLSRTRYVIQLDADTLTLAGIDEVRSAVRNGQSFSIGTWDGQVIEAAVDRAHAAQARISGAKPHIQLLAEAHFDRLNEAPALKYVRGCAGFSGFARGEGKLELMRNLSGQLQALLGDRWLEWGSEQVMSNLVVANQQGAIVLPHPEYADCIKMRQGTTRFIHFIGTCRFQGGIYARLIGGFNWGKR
ncbi:MAG: hypothetical protein ABS91_01905 [Thiobacillus sp. SCN 64-35]|nr:MAG: hypothetical protein ABS91_01905 [Thiobacillus sp. SCN 64-35]